MSASPTIKNLETLRNKLLEGFQDLITGKIDQDKASIMAKMSEAIVSGVKTQLEYARLTKQEPNIAFLESSTRTYHQEKEKKATKLLGRSRGSK